MSTSIAQSLPLKNMPMHTIKAFLVGSDSIPRALIALNIRELIERPWSAIFFRRGAVPNGGVAAHEQQEAYAE